MIGILLLYFIGKKFYDLAALHEKHKWGNALAAIGVYYGATLLVGLIIGIYYVWIGKEDFNEFLVNLLAVPFGLLACWLFYNFKKQRFENKVTFIADTLDSEFLTED